MTAFEYKVVPAPERGRKAKGVKGTANRFALELQTVMNTLGADGWEYVRSDTLPCEERTGLTGKTTTYQNMLVFRRSLSSEVEQTPEVTALLAAPVAETEAPSAPVAAPPSAPQIEDSPPAPKAKTAAAAAAAAALTAQRPPEDETIVPVGPATRDPANVAAE